MSRQRIVKLIARVIVWVAVVGALIVLVVKVSDLSGRLSSDEHLTCLVQSRGLRATPHLAASMEDLSLLLASGNSGQERRRGVPPRTIRLLMDLQAQSSRYSRIESKQPASRRC